jgi:hypothetical protein
VQVAIYQRSRLILMGFYQVVSQSFSAIFSRFYRAPVVSNRLFIANYAIVEKELGANFPAKFTLQAFSAQLRF